MKRLMIIAALAALAGVSGGSLGTTDARADGAYACNGCESNGHTAVLTYPYTYLEHQEKFCKALTSANGGKRYCYPGPRCTSGQSAPDPTCRNPLHSWTLIQCSVSGVCT